MESVLFFRSHVLKNNFCIVVPVIYRNNIISATVKILGGDRTPETPHRSKQLIILTSSQLRM